MLHNPSCLRPTSYCTGTIAQAFNHFVLPHDHIACSTSQQSDCSDARLLAACQILQVLSLDPVMMEVPS